MSFIPAAELKKTYFTEGAFYQRVVNGEVYTCRSLARVRRKNIDEERVDALFVMVNPGSCQPEDKNYQIPEYEGVLPEVQFVPAKSDPTQYQIMRLMECKGWNTVYIVNLSDLRAGNIDDFREQLKQFEFHKDDSHSIFSASRIIEFERLIESDMQVIVGWGVQPFMKSKMIEALTIISDLSKIYGLPHPIYPYYYHPFPMVQHKCIKWLDDICRNLERNDNVG